MSKYLIVYGTKEGQTAKISDRIGEVFRQRGHTVDIHDARKIPSTFKFEGYSGALIGSSIHIGQYSSPVIQFAKQYKSQLEGVPSTFFSVSMQAASATPEERARLDPWIQKFFNKCDWHPKDIRKLCRESCLYAVWVVHEMVHENNQPFEGSGTRW